MNEQDKKTTEIIALAISAGIKDAGASLKKFLLIQVVIGMAFYFAVAAISGRFDEDDTDGKKRSNMELHTDNKTGCQYLSGIRGGLTPRISTNGVHVGCR